MTTIAWDGKTLAADRQVTFGHSADGEINKIVKRKKDGALCGTSGSTTVGAAFKRWFLKGGNGDCSVDLDKDKDNPCSAFIIYSPKRIIFYNGDGWYQKENDKFAEGSGWALALGAMSAGANAKEAVLIAAKYNTSTGSNVDTLELGK